MKTLKFLVPGLNAGNTQLIGGSWMSWGNHIVRGSLVLASLGLLGINAAMDYRFGSGFGRSELDGDLYGGASALSDVLKAVLPFALACAFAQRRWGSVIAGGILWIVCVAFSFASATGLGISARTFTSDAATIQATLNREELAALQSGQEELIRVRAQLAAPNLRSRDRQDLEQREASLSQKTSTLRNRLAYAPSILTANGQAEAIAQVLSVDPSRVSNGLVVLLASLLELASGLGLYVATSAYFTDAKVRSSHKPMRKVPSRPAANGRDHSRRKATNNVVSLSANRDTATINGFLSHETRIRKGSHTEASDLRRMLTTYCKGRGFPVPSARRFGEAMRSRGHAKDRRGRGGRVRYLNVELANLQTLAA
jgi:hypothetical protein